MEYGTKVTDALTTMGQVRVEQLQAAVQEGFKAVLNLRVPNELGFWADEQRVAESLGLHYIHIPLRLEHLDEAVIDQILCQLDHLPKPVLVHCAAGMRSTVIALLSTAIAERLTPQQVVEKAYAIGFHHIDNTLVSPQLRERFFDYLARHSQERRQAA
ncbi:beta-lactamase hydrolase domain-containing protein [Nodosilinea sp. PGN35]|uniref:beta-lactamase hydrolase domain-containing protein n=1 Tax=Nodosilinea sp. PGN35 TaxID=3020489 RepID=UPI0023B25310|nr:sulfur transferase domain-containing protein [Nodosilinea sp. TSF1-S3]MDF0366313.1 sulfur transferase domain-containing protein [Nodosilinea sp. TSF1-S3]